MQAKSSITNEEAELRQRAEARLCAQQQDFRSQSSASKPKADSLRLLHELQVHQVELELQNAELQEARDRMEVLLGKYTDLYDFAPAGYFSLDERGCILEVNLSGAVLLGEERSRLGNRRFTQFVARTNQPAFLAFLKQVFAKTGTYACEALLQRQDGRIFCASLHAVSAIAHSDPRKWCRVAVSDITSLKEAVETKRRLEALAVTNQMMRREIARRQAVEKALRKSEQYQSQLLEHSRHMQEQLRLLSRRLLRAQEDERKRISRELHDEIAQILVGINVHLETLARKADLNPKTVKRMIVKTQRVVERSVHIVHQFARELRPTALDDLGLIAALHSLLKDFMTRTGIRVQFTAFAGVESLDSDRHTVLYRVVQSALTNVAQHAQASQVKVRIRKHENAVQLEVTDNGKSFNVERVLHAKNNKHLGLIGMRERVEMIGGGLAVESAPGSGTTIRVRIPFG